MTAGSFSSADAWSWSIPAALAKRWRRLALLGALAAASALGSTAARADLRLCNMTTSRVGIAVGYRDPQGWVTEGWWNLNPHGCETLLKWPLAAVYF